MKLLVTGGCGFIGSAVCRYFVAKGAFVVNIDKMTYAATDGSTASIARSGRYAHIKADICDVEALASAFKHHKPDAVIHLAAESHVDRSITGPAAFVEANIVGAFHLLNAALDYWKLLDADDAARFRFVHVSTDEVYGTLGAEGFFTEQTPYAPNSPYAASKAGSDHLASAWFHTYGLPVIISNCSNNFGPYQFPEKLIPLTLINCLRRRPLPVYGTGENVRDWLHVDDHVEALEAILVRGAPGQSYNIGSRNERTNLGIVQTVCDTIDDMMPGDAPRRSLIRFVQDRPGHDHRYAIDPSFIEKALNWRSHRSFESSLQETARWYIDNEAWWRPILERQGEHRLGLLDAPSN